MLIHHTLRMCYLYHGSGLVRHGIKLWLHLSLCKWGPHKAYIQLLCCCSVNSAKLSFLESLANFILHFRYVECWYFSLSQLLRHSVPHPFSTVCVHPSLWQFYWQKWICWVLAVLPKVPICGHQNKHWFGQNSPGHQCTAVIHAFLGWEAWR